jgi:Zn-dependent protease
MAWSFPLFRIFGIRVRVHFFLAIWLAALLLQGWVKGGLPGMGWHAGTLAILFATVLFHELAHCWMAIRVGAGAEEILLWPLGGMAYVGQTGSMRDEIKVAAAGPLSNFVLAGACLGALLLTGAPWDWNHLNPFAPWWQMSSLAQTFLVHAVRINLILGLFNLCIPAYPLDGGRILFAWLTIRHGRHHAAVTTARIALVAGAVMAVWGLAQNDLMLILIGVWVLMESFQVLRLARMGEVGAHPAFGGAPEHDTGRAEPDRPGFFARWRDRRESARAEREALEARELDLKVDEVLGKVSREGIGSLTPEERAILQRASERSRRE